MAETPAGTDLFHINASSPLLSPAESKRLHRGIMLMAWIASRVRIDWCVAVGFLRTRVDKLTEEDKTKFYRVIKYINKYPDLKLQLTANQELRLYGWIDASYGVHESGHSHTGALFNLGDRGGAILAESTKQKLVTTSSSEAEFVGLSDKAKKALWIHQYLEHKRADGKPQPTTCLF